MKHYDFFPIVVSSILSFLLGLLSTFIFGVWKKYSDSRKELLVKCQMCVLATPWLISGESTSGIPLINVSVVNMRSRSVTIKQVGIGLKNKKIYTQLKSSTGGNPLPSKLEDGDTVDFYFDLDGLAKALIENDTSMHFAYAQDTLGKMYKTQIPKSVRERIRYLTLVLGSKKL